METQRHLFPGEFSGGSTKGQGEGCGVSVRRLSSVPATPAGQIPTMPPSKHTSQQSQPFLLVLISPQMPCGAMPQTLNFVPNPIYHLYPSVWEIHTSTNSNVWPSYIPNSALGIQGGCQ